MRWASGYALRADVGLVFDELRSLSWQVLVVPRDLSRYF